jgi:hypothetical protein
LRLRSTSMAINVKCLKTDQSAACKI